METKKSIINQAIKDGAIEITILEGAAPVHKDPKAVSINGTITAPRKFIEKRTKTFDKNKSHALVNKFNGTIDLNIDETNPKDNYTIYGKIKKAALFVELGINSEKNYSTDSLSKKLRMLRSIFVDKNQHASVVANLRNFVAKVNQEIESDNDLKGNKSLAFRQKVESNIPETFAIRIPIIEGEEPETFEVAVIVEVGSSTEVVCTLESVESKDLFDVHAEKIITSEVEYLEKETTVIFV